MIVLCSVAVALCALEVPPGTTPPERTMKWELKHPASAEEEGVGGIVVLRALVNEKGKPTGIEVVSSPDERLSKAATNAFTFYRYKPALRSGVPVAVLWEESFKFTPASEVRKRDATCDPALVERADPNSPEEIVLPKLLRKVEAKVTREMHQDPSRGGKVVLACRIDVCGVPQDCDVQKSTGAPFEKSALEAVSQWRYDPATKGGKPIDMFYTVRFDFRW